MMKLLILATSFFALIATITAQKTSSSFILKGTVNIDSGQVYLKSAGKNSYYPRNTIFKGSKILNGIFEISDSCSYPFEACIIIKVNSEIKYLSDYFFIEPGIQTVQCNIDSLRAIPHIENKTMKELRDSFLVATSVIDEELVKNEQQYYTLYKKYEKNIPDDLLVNYEDERVALKVKRKQVLYQYSIQHPRSYVVLWELIKQLENGYEPILDSIYGKLIPSVKKTYAGKELSNKLASLRILGTGKDFPVLSLADINLSNKKLDIGAIGSKYILVDFWYSHCDPCISQFPGIKKIYDEYSKKGFSIIGISVDTKDNIPAWKNAITQYGLNWPQYLDLGGNQSSKFSIHLFPTNLLLDSSGKIIRRDIEIAQLATFLKQKSL